MDSRAADSETPAPPTAGFREDVIAGLTATPKRISPKYFYDRRGAVLFEQICELPEYYPTRTELTIMRRHCPEMAGLIGPRVQVIELGSGSGLKTRLLLKHLDLPVSYVPVDISGEMLQHTAAELGRLYPEITVQPVHADFLGEFELPRPPRPARGRLVYFPGSTIGNFTHRESVGLMSGVARICRPDGALLIGVDLKKDKAVLEAAYDDSVGVTAEFNLNLLHRIRDELGADLDVDAFEHYAFYNERDGRIEMHLRSTRDQSFTIDGVPIAFAAGETVHTENSHKYTPDEFAVLAADSGFERMEIWTDDHAMFSVQLFRVTS
jgi:dimethylhistidine N-methyltransferase